MKGVGRVKKWNIGIINEIIDGIMDEMIEIINGIINEIINKNNLLCVDLPRSSKVHPQLDLLVKHAPHLTTTNCCLLRR